MYLLNKPRQSKTKVVLHVYPYVAQVRTSHLCPLGFQSTLLGKPPCKLVVIWAYSHSIPNIFWAMINASGVVDPATKLITVKQLRRN